jgi:predicted metal-binding membrane protein
VSSLTLTPRREDPGLRSLLTATRGQAPLVVALVGAAGVCWWWTAERFVAGYLLVWAAAGVGAWAALGLGRHLLGGQLAWSSGGRWLAGGVLVLAGAYELTPLKFSCLGRCRSPLADLRGAASDGPVEAIHTGARIGGVCLGCCAGLMAALFALGS